MQDSHVMTIGHSWNLVKRKKVFKRWRDEKLYSAVCVVTGMHRNKENTAWPIMVKFHATISRVITEMFNDV